MSVWLACAGPWLQPTRYRHAHERLAIPYRRFAGAHNDREEGAGGACVIGNLQMIRGTVPRTKSLSVAAIASTLSRGRDPPGARRRTGSEEPVSSGNSRGGLLTEPCRGAFIQSAAGTSITRLLTVHAHDHARGRHTARTIPHISHDQQHAAASDGIWLHGLETSQGRRSVPELGLSLVAGPGFEPG
jgi:hypothetical protein